MKNKLTKILSIIIILSFFIISGCGIWNNFKTYFNRYYNASTLFEDAETLIKSEPKDIFEFKEPKVSGQVNQILDKVVEKCSKILELDTATSYLDIALLMTGKSFYYQQNYPKAYRKFNELTLLKDSDLLLENKLWIGKTELQLREFDKGFQTLEEVKTEAAEKEEMQILEEAYIKQIAFLIYRERFEDAVVYCRQLLGIAEEDELKALAQYEVGKLFYEMGDLEKADTAFALVMNFSPEPDVEFNSRFERSTVEKELGFIDESLEILDNLKSESKFEESWDKVDLEIGRIYYEKGNIEEAMHRFRDIDTTYSRTESGGIASFLLAQIWEKNLRNYDSAVVYYDRTVAASVPKEYKDNAKLKSTDIGKYFVVSGDLNKAVKQLEYSVNPQIFIEDSIAYEEFIFQDTSKLFKQGIQTSPNDSGSFRKGKFPGIKGGDSLVAATEDTLENINPRIVRIKPQRPKLATDSLMSIVAQKEFELANVFYVDLDVPDSSFYYYSDIAANYPRNRNTPQVFFALGNHYLSVRDTAKADSFFTIIYNDYRNDEIVNQAAKILGKPPVEFKTDEAEKLFIQAENEYDQSKFESAISLYGEVYRKYPESTFAPKALLAEGWIYENELELLSKAAAVYDTLNKKYPASEYAHLIIPKLNVYRQEQNRIKAVEDSIRLAKEEKARQDSLQRIAKEVPNKNIQPVSPDSNTVINIKTDSLDNFKRILKQRETGDSSGISETQLLRESPELNADSNTGIIFPPDSLLLDSVKTSIPVDTIKTGSDENQAPDSLQIIIDH